MLLACGCVCLNQSWWSDFYANVSISFFFWLISNLSALFDIDSWRETWQTTGDTQQRALAGIKPRPHWQTPSLNTQYKLYHLSYRDSHSYDLMRKYCSLLGQDRNTLLLSQHEGVCLQPIQIVEDTATKNHKVRAFPQQCGACAEERSLCSNRAILMSDFHTINVT